jgi:hypothetical protein
MDVMLTKAATELISGAGVLDLEAVSPAINS